MQHYLDALTVLPGFIYQAQNRRCITDADGRKIRAFDQCLLGVRIYDDTFKVRLWTGEYRFVVAAVAEEGDT